MLRRPFSKRRNPSGRVSRGVRYIKVLVEVVEVSNQAQIITSGTYQSLRRSFDGNPSRHDESAPRGRRQ